MQAQARASNTDQYMVLGKKRSHKQQHLQQLQSGTAPQHNSRQRGQGTNHQVLQMHAGERRAAEGAAAASTCSNRDNNSDRVSSDQLSLPALGSPIRGQIPLESGAETRNRDAHVADEAALVLPTIATTSGKLSGREGDSSKVG